MAEIDIKALRDAAQAATPGPWKRRKGFDCEIYHPDKSIKPPFMPGEVARIPNLLDNWRANSAYIAACDPTTILALLDNLKRAEAVAEAARAYMESCPADEDATKRFQAATTILRRALAEYRGAPGADQA